MLQVLIYYYYFFYSFIIIINSEKQTLAVIKGDVDEVDDNDDVEQPITSEAPTKLKTSTIEAAKDLLTVSRFNFKNCFVLFLIILDIFTCAQYIHYHTFCNLSQRKQPYRLLVYKLCSNFLFFLSFSQALRTIQGPKPHVKQPIAFLRGLF